MANELGLHQAHACTVRGCPNRATNGLTCDVHNRRTFKTVPEPKIALPSWSWGGIAALILGSVTVCAFIGYLLLTVWNIPTLVQSYGTGECLHVTAPYDCENMPVKFHHVWGK